MTIMDGCRSTLALPNRNFAWVILAEPNANTGCKNARMKESVPALLKRADIGQANILVRTMGCEKGSSNSEATSTDRTNTIDNTLGSGIGEEFNSGLVNAAKDVLVGIGDAASPQHEI